MLSEVDPMPTWCSRLRGQAETVHPFTRSAWAAQGHGQRRGLRKEFWELGDDAFQTPAIVEGRHPTVSRVFEQRRLSCAET
jgi:hypothetical protein